MWIPYQWETWRPRVLGVLAATLAACAGLGHASVTAIVTSVLPVVLTAAVILAGFVTIAQWLLLLLIDRTTVAQLRATGHYDSLAGCLWEAGRAMSCFVTVAMSILVIHACGFVLPAHDRLVPASLAGCFIWVCLSGLQMILHKDASTPAA